MELRKDYVLDRWVYYSPARGQRPKEIKRNPVEKVSASCFFCPGSESSTPPEIGRTGEPWKLRWFDNKFAAVSEEGSPKMVKVPFQHAAAFGKHEVIVETPDHDRQAWDLSEQELQDILNVYRNRITELEKRKKIKYALVFKNHGIEGGTSIIHSHSQVIATAAVPPLVKDELRHSIRKGVCEYCRIIAIESESERKCFSNNSFVSFAPYASRFHYETWIFPKKHIGRMEELSDAEMADLAAIMRQTLAKLKELNLDYNFFIHHAPKKEKLHFHIEITPRDATWAGFEMGSNAVINSVTAEAAAEFYRK